MNIPKVTTLSPMNEGLGGAIDWKKDVIEVNGVTKPAADVKHKLGGTFSL